MAEPVEKEPAAELMAVIDIGSNAMRMVVAQSLEDGRMEHLENAHRAIRLGQDTFVSGKLSRKTMNAAIAILRDYRRMLDGYGIKHVRAVATSSVREAGNSDSFVDRVFMATGIEVEILDTSEEIRLTVEAVRQALGAAVNRPGKCLLADIGGGSALLSVMQKGDVLNSGSYPLGAIRLQELLTTMQEPPARAVELLRHAIANVVASIRQALPLKAVGIFVAVGGDARLAAQQVGMQDAGRETRTITAGQFDSFVTRCQGHTAEELSQIFHVPFADAETLVPALLVYQELRRATRAKSILVPAVSMRDGLLLDLALGLRGKESRDLYTSSIQSAKAIGEKYHFSPDHAFHVAQLAEVLFDQLQKDHGLSARHRLLLRLAAILHEVGGFVSSRSHHKHSYYLIANSEIFGLRRAELQIVALVARYHRRSLPRPTHLEYMMLDRDSRIAVSKLAAILRVADALDRGHAQQIRDIRVERQGEDFLIFVQGVPDLALERRALAVKADLFEEIYGLRVRLEEAQRL
jgi:exopolyphosphatase / guanosine-5'-triphosphate,3'-diphosphate pyrophosphatase